MCHVVVISRSKKLHLRFLRARKSKRDRLATVHCILRICKNYVNSNWSYFTTSICSILSCGNIFVPLFKRHNSRHHFYPKQFEFFFVCSAPANSCKALNELHLLTPLVAHQVALTWISTSNRHGCSTLFVFCTI